MQKEHLSKLTNKILNLDISNYDYDSLNKKKKKKTVAKDDYTDKDLKRLVRRAIKETSLPVPKDIKVDDSDLGVAPNFLEFITRSKYMGQESPPYGQQMKLALEFFGEFNPKKSNMKWFNDIPVDAKPDDFRENMCLLKRGKCPRTGITRSELINSGQLPLYTEIAACWGQRCITGESEVLTVNGNIAFKNLAKDAPLGYSDYNGPDLIIETGEIVKASKIFVAEAEPLLKITFSNGSCIKGTKEHPIFVLNLGFTILSELNLNYIVPYYTWSKEKLHHYIDLVEVIKIEECEPEVTYDIVVPKYKRFIANGFINHNSGKSTVSAFMNAYSIHHLLKMQNPAQALGLLKSGSLLTISLISLTFSQARDNLYIPLYNMIADSKWFTEYHSILDYYSNKYGEELYKFKDTFLSYRHRNLVVAPSGPDKRILRGKTRWGFALDEVDWIFSSSADSVKYNVEEIYASLKNSMRSAIGGYKKLIKQGYNVIPPLACNISSPSSKYGMMLTLYDKSKEVKSILGSHLATHEVNPSYTYDELYEEIALVQGEAVFLRDFMAVPPLSSNPFIEDVSDIKGNISSDHVNAFTIKPKYFEKRAGKTVMSGKVVFNFNTHAVNTCFAIDAGYNNNSFAFAVGHNVISDGEYFPVLDGIGELIPSVETPINHSLVMEDIIKPIISNMNVKYLVADRWQSLKMLTDAEDSFDIETEQYSLKYSDFNNFRDDIISSKLIIPKCEMKLNKITKLGDKNYPHSFKNIPVAHFIFQCLTVQDQRGKTVTKGHGLTDDILRAVVLLHSYLSDPNYRDKFEGTALTRVEKGTGAVATMSTRSGMSTGYNVSNVINSKNIAVATSSSVRLNNSSLPGVITRVR